MEHFELACSAKDRLVMQGVGEDVAAAGRVGALTVPEETGG
jgi:hypothetical protein